MQKFSRALRPLHRASTGLPQLRIARHPLLLNKNTAQQTSLQTERRQHRFFQHRTALLPAAQPSKLQLRLNQTTHDLPANITYLVGVAMLRQPYDLGRSELFILKRADKSKQFPSLWYVGGGHIEPGETIREAVKRETFEETKLLINIVEQFEELKWTSKDGRQNVQLNFIATIRASNYIVLDSREHSEWAWMSKEGMEKYPCSEGMGKVFRDAFDWAERRKRMR